MVIVVGNGHGDTSSNPGWDWLHFTYLLTNEKTGLVIFIYKSIYLSICKEPGNE